MENMIIALSGYGTAGKDTVAQILVEHAEFERHSFADPLKQMLYALNPIIEPGYLDDSVHLQTFVDGQGWDVVKMMPEVRGLLQRLGTEACRKYLGEDIWARTLVKHFGRVGHQGNLVIADWRFKSEAEVLYECADIGPTTRIAFVRINRPGVGPLNDHISETQLDDFNFDYVIENDGTLERLVEKVHFMYLYFNLPKVD